MQAVWWSRWLETPPSESRVGCGTYCHTLTGVRMGRGFGETAVDSRFTAQGCPCLTAYLQSGCASPLHTSILAVRLRLPTRVRRFYFPCEDVRGWLRAMEQRLGQGQRVHQTTGELGTGGKGAEAPSWGQIITIPDPMIVRRHRISNLTRLFSQAPRRTHLPPKSSPGCQRSRKRAAPGPPSRGAAQRQGRLHTSR